MRSVVEGSRKVGRRVRGRKKGKEERGGEQSGVEKGVEVRVGWKSNEVSGKRPKVAQIQMEDSCSTCPHMFAQHLLPRPPS